MRRFALVGARGMLGRDLLRRAGAFFECVPANREDLDITRRDRVLRWVEEVRPEVLVNVAAYTDVDGCETRQEWAMQVNGEAVGYLAEGCRRAGSGMIHVSTDFVFDGTKPGPYTEEDTVNPLSVYGASKLLGEKRLAEHLDRFLIVRTSWLFGLGGRNFVEAILRQAREKMRLRVVKDQVGSPTYVPDLSGAILKLAGAGAQGIVHVCNSGSCSWFELARAILELSGHSDVSVEPMTSMELNRPARRPANSVLSCDRYVRITGEQMRPWQQALRDYLQSRKE